MGKELAYIEASKHRCKRLGLNPRIIPAFSEFIRDGQLIQKRMEYEEILVVSRFFVNKILALMKGVPVLVIITDQIGTVLELAGDEAIKKTVQELGIKEGIQFREEESGTNTVNLSLIHHQPVQLCGQDHYHEFLFKSACYSVPFYYTDVNNLLGTISIMTSIDHQNPVLLTMLCMVADSVERELLLRRKNSSLDSEVESYKSKLDFIHFISHEIRNPLTIINAYATLLRNYESGLSPEGLKKIVEIENYVKVIDYELTHIIETEQMLANDLYLKKGPVKLLLILQEVANLMVAKAHTQRIAFKYNVNLDEYDRIIGNKTGLRLIISNLLSNAIKYSNQDGVVSFRAYRERGQIKLVIEDNGVGMTKEQMKSLFIKYGKQNESRSGLGIGLYIVKQLVDYFQGTIHIDSEIGYGTIVNIVFPVHEG